MKTKPVEEIVTGTAVVLDETNYPAELCLFHTNNEYDNKGNITQPAGWKLPGGRYEKPRDKTPRHAARNETLLETGLKVIMAKFFSDSEFGEALYESKTKIADGYPFQLKVYTFLMKKVDRSISKRFETEEGGATGNFSLRDILLMPLARNTKTGDYNPYGIQFSARKRIFITLYRAGYDFLKLIPDLSKFFDELDPDKVGEEVYWILLDALNLVDACNAPGEEYVNVEERITQKNAPVTSEHEKDCDCDACWRRFAESLKKLL